MLTRTLNIPLFICFFFSGLSLFAQNIDTGNFSGGLETTTKLFLKDSKIGADNTPQYERQLVGSEAWLDLKYSQYGFDLALRFDIFNNTNLLDPQDSYTDQGIGIWSIAKTIDKFSIKVGHIYDQIGSGIIYRAYEARPLLIDNALIGGRLGYTFNENWSAKVFTGRQRNLFDNYSSIIRGASIDGFASFGEDNPLTLAPGIGFVNRTYSDDVMDDLIGILQTYAEEDRFLPTYNTYAYSVFNTLSYGPITWYVEGAYKSNDAFFDPNADRINAAGGLTPGKYVRRSGTVIYSSLSYAANGLGITVEGKRTENFSFRTNPFVRNNMGFVSFIPPMVRENTYRLTARYNPATQELGELAYQVDVGYAFNKKLSANVNFSNITDLNSELLYREIYTEIHYKHKRKWHLLGGVQIQNYNQQVYEIKANAPMVETVTPYLEFLYRFNRTNSLRTELSYMATEQDFGSWVFMLTEYGMAPHWFFEVSGMYNIDPVRTDKIFYPSVGIAYTANANRYALRYVKQVEGVVCTGGICRLEPAFSGFQFSVNSSF